MSTLKATNLSHASAASPNIVLDSAGKVTFGGAVAGAGLDLITPTSVAGTGVTVSGGQVSFTAASTASANGVFTATYNNYLLVYSFTSTSNANIYFRLRASGTDSTASYLGMCRGYTYSTGSAATIDYGSTGVFVLISQGANAKIGGSLDIISPFIAESTTAFGLAARDSLFSSTGGIQTAATAYDGLTLLPSAGTMTGNLRVYGYRNS